MLLNRVGTLRKARGLVYELRRFASVGTSPGGGASLHWHMCKALIGHATSQGWRPGMDLTLVLTLQSCTWRAGGFYKKMGWKGDTKQSKKKKFWGKQSSSVAMQVTKDDIGALMRLDLADQSAWSRYWERPAPSGEANSDDEDLEDIDGGEDVGDDRTH